VKFIKLLLDISDKKAKAAQEAQIRDHLHADAVMEAQQVANARHA
jgi:hypothetical protein